MCIRVDKVKGRRKKKEGRRKIEDQRRKPKVGRIHTQQQLELSFESANFTIVSRKGSCL
jgi:hypothetical protein